MRRVFMGVFWLVIAAAVVFHVAAGWSYAGELIADGFEPQPEPLPPVSGDYERETVSYPTALGPMTAWYLPAPGDTWVIHVHGKGTTPAEAEPLFTALQRAGYPQLAITYRNDAGQPADPSGFYRYGETEWEDVSAAVDHAVANGAARVVLSGFSTGASHIMAFLARRSVEQVAGVILDAPNLDFGDTVSYAASKRKLPFLGLPVPATVTEVAKFLTSMRTGVNWQAVDYISGAGLVLRRPVLIHHGTADETVPLRQSEGLAAARPDLVTLVRLEGAGHVESYLADPGKYRGAVLGFLAEIG